MASWSIPGIGLALLATMLMSLIRALRGPSLYDRILAVNLFGTLTVLLIAVLGFLMGRPEWLDLALGYALINFISTLAVLRFAQRRPFSAALAPPAGTGENPR